ncbi:hypothetical protein WJX72_010903 [[Myrmecia] bisecta]|uniref:Steroid 5-alpha reductase C-terminal domain-containing protein n=1 Tax=[Myrmecia] bisecta TaxID=41462 RepID=A0AAW1PFW4_9CHLO
MWTIGSLGITASALVGVLILDFIIQWVAWVVAAALQTDKFYDLLGSSTFIALSIASLVYAKYYYARHITVTVLVCIWGLRLGFFLVVRVLKTKGDSRFEEVKKQPVKYWVYWTFQAVWVFLTLLPVTVLNATAANPGLWASDIIGGVLWAVGFYCESVADAQKFLFKNNPANKGRFISTGLWRYSRYPNYFGEMCMWWGVWLICIPAFDHQRGYYATIVGPLFVMMLLLGVSGVPIQEKQAKERWGQDPSYQAYRRRTWLLVPLPKFGQQRAGGSQQMTTPINTSA